MKRSICLMIVFILVMSVFAGCGKEEEEEIIAEPIYKTKDIVYETEEAVIGDITQKYYVDGYFGYPYFEKVSFKTDGLIEEILVEEGDRVKKGDLLCTLDPEELDAQLEEKLVYLEQAKKTLQTLRSEGGSAKEIEMSEVQLEALQLEYDHMQDSYSDYEVKAPCDGVFYPDRGSAFGHSIEDQRGAENLIIEGGAVTAGQVFGKIEDHSQQYLLCDVFDEPLENVNFGTRVMLEQGVTEAQGKVIDTINNDSGGMVSYTYVIETEKDSGLSDLQVRCCFDVYSKLDTVIVPSKAIKTSKDRSYVNLLIDGTKIEQDVEVGIEDGDRTEISGGLSGGEQVIIN